MAGGGAGEGIVVAIEAGLAAAGGGAGGEGPLLGAVVGEQGVAEAAAVADATGGESHEFVVHRRRIGPGELALKAQAPPQLREDRPVGPGLARGLAEGRAERHAPLGVDHHPRLLAPLGGGQHQVGHGLGFSAGVGLAHHHQRAAGHRGAHPIQRRQAHQRVGGRHPPEVELAPLHRLDLLPDAESGRGGNGTGGDPPVALHLDSMLGVGHGAVAGQQLGQAAHLAAAHGVGLAGEGEGAGAGAADLAAHQVQVDDAADGGGALPALVDPHRPEAEHRRAGDPPGGELAQGGLLDAAHGAGALRCPGAPEGGELVEALRVGRHKGGVDANPRAAPLRRPLQQQVAEAAEQGQVGAGTDRQVQVGGIAGGGGARVGGHQPQGVAHLALAFEQPLEEHRMALGGVGADQQHQGGGVEVVVAAGGAIGAEAAAVAGHGRTHAQARVGIEVVAAEGALEQLVGGVVVLAEELAGAIDRQGARAPIRQGGADALHQDREGPLPGDRRERLVGAGAPEGGGEPVAVQGFAHRGALDAHLAEGGGVVAVAAHAPDGFGPILRGRIARRRPQLQAATHAAVGALGPGDSGGGAQGGDGGASHCSAAGKPLPVASATNAALSADHGTQARGCGCTAAMTENVDKSSADPLKSKDAGFVNENTL